MLWILYLIFVVFDLAVSFVTYLVYPAKDFYGIHRVYTHYYPQIQVPPFLVSFANFDGVHYLRLAKEGYNWYDRAFFPLYPLVVHIFSPAFLFQYFWTGFILSHIFFLGGLYFFYKYLQLIGKSRQTIFWVLLFLLFFPTSFFFSSTYTESLMFLLIVGVVYFIEKKKIGYAIIFAFFSALTRLTGIFTILILFTYLYGTKLSLLYPFTKKNLTKIRILPLLKKLLLLLFPVFGLVMYMIYSYIYTKDPLIFYHVQPDFGAQRSTHLILLPQVYFRYIKIFLTANHDFLYFVSFTEFSAFTLVFGMLIYDLVKLWENKKNEKASLFGLNLFSLCNILLPTLTGTFSSIPRYALLSISFFIRMAEVKNIFIKVAMLVCFIIMHIVLIAFFVQGFFVG